MNKELEALKIELDLTRADAAAYEDIIATLEQQLLETKAVAWDTLIALTGETQALVALFKLDGQLGNAARDILERGLDAPHAHEAAASFDILQRVADTPGIRIVHVS